MRRLILIALLLTGCGNGYGADDHPDRYDCKCFVMADAANLPPPLVTGKICVVCDGGVR